jgi:hypothetical protein
LTPRKPLLAKKLAELLEVRLNLEGDVVAVGGVVSTTAAEDDLSGQFFDDFATALANHRAWERETDSVPA